MTEASDTTAKIGDLQITLATWLSAVRDAGHPLLDPRIDAAAVALSAATGAEARAQGAALVALLREGLDDDASPAAVAAYLNGLLGEGKVGPVTAGDRDSRTRALRSYQYRTSLPLVARIYDRFPDGTVGPHWVMIERVTDQVSCMDPYPWDDIDEAIWMPLIEFHVKWELADNVCFAWNG